MHRCTGVMRLTVTPFLGQSQYLLVCNYCAPLCVAGSINAFVSWVVIPSKTAQLFITWEGRRECLFFLECTATGAVTAPPGNSRRDAQLGSRKTAADTPRHAIAQASQRLCDLAGLCQAVLRCALFIALHGMLS